MEDNSKAPNAIKLIAPRMIHINGIDWLPGEIRPVSKELYDQITNKEAWWGPSGGKLFGPPSWHLPGENGEGESKPGLLAYSEEGALARIKLTKDLITLETWARYEESSKAPRANVMKALESQWNATRIKLAKDAEKAAKGAPPPTPQPPTKPEGSGAPPPPPPPPVPPKPPAK